MPLVLKFIVKPLSERAGAAHVIFAGDQGCFSKEQDDRSTEHQCSYT